MAKVTVVTDQGLRTLAQARDLTWHADEPLDKGGSNVAATPMEQLLGALGSCIVITVHMYAQRKNWPLDKVEVQLEIERFNAPDYPAYKGDAQFIHEIREKVTLHGSLDDEQHSRLMEIATKCPLRRLLQNPVYFVEAVKTPIAQA